MARRVVVRLTDDLDGSEIRSSKGGTVQFSLDDKAYEIDLSARNAAALRRTLQPYIAAGRPKKVPRRRRGI